MSYDTEQGYAQASQLKAAAAGYAFSNGSVPGAPTNASFTEQLHARLSQLQATLADAHDSMCALSDRMLGSMPSPGQNQSLAAGKSAGNSLSEGILAVTDLLQTGAEELSRRARILNQRI